jgi:hypothetical protein
MSTTGVPSMASRPRTVSVLPSTVTRSQMHDPIRLGRSLALWANMPTSGHCRLPRGWRAVEHEEHLDVTEFVEPSQRAGGKVGRKGDRALERAPVIVDRLFPRIGNDADGRHLERLVGCSHEPSSSGGRGSRHMGQTSGPPKGSWISPASLNP